VNSKWECPTFPNIIFLKESTKYNFGGAFVAENEPVKKHLLELFTMCQQHLFTYTLERRTIIASNFVMQIFTRRICNSMKTQ